MRIVDAESAQRAGEFEYVVEVAAALSGATANLRCHLLNRCVTQEGCVVGRREIGNAGHAAVVKANGEVLASVAILFAMIQLFEDIVIYEEGSAEARFARCLDQCDDAPRVLGITRIVLTGPSMSRQIVLR